MEAILPYFTCFMCSIVGIPLVALTIWSMVWKLTAYVYFLDLKLDVTFLALPGGILTIPCVVLTLLLKRHKLKHVIAFLVINVLAILVLFTGYFMGTRYQLHHDNETVRLSHTIPTQPLNHTLYGMLIEYETDPENNTDLDKLQKAFTCCGVNGVQDFVEIPTSCCETDACQPDQYYLKGCLRQIQENVAWHKNVMQSVIQLFILMYFFNAAMVICIFISDHYKWRGIQKSKMKQSS